MAMTSGLKGAFQAGLEIYGNSHAGAIAEWLLHGPSSAKLTYLRAMRKLTFDEIQQRRIAAVEAHQTPRSPLRAILNNVRSLYNVGSIFRSADAFWMDQLILTGYTPRPPRKEIEKTALGATLTVPWTYIQDPVEAVGMCRKEGWSVWAVEQTTGSQSLPIPIMYGSRIVLVFGNEVSGIDADVLAACDRAVEIPMHGTKHSLNVAVAFGIATHLVSTALRTSSDATR
jgi:tRNA G18 (ribose-2'-O)-methylase SpoU